MQRMAEERGPVPHDSIQNAIVSKIQRSLPYLHYKSCIFPGHVDFLYLKTEHTKHI